MVWPGHHRDMSTTSKHIFWFLAIPFFSSFFLPLLVLVLVYCHFCLVILHVPRALHIYNRHCWLALVLKYVSVCNDQCDGASCVFRSTGHCHKTSFLQMYLLCLLYDVCVFFSGLI